MLKSNHKLTKNVKLNLNLGVLLPLKQRLYKPFHLHIYELNFMLYSWYHLGQFVSYFPLFERVKSDS